MQGQRTPFRWHITWIPYRRTTWSLKMIPGRESFEIAHLSGVYKDSWTRSSPQEEKRQDFAFMWRSWTRCHTHFVEVQAISAAEKSGSCTTKSPANRLPISSYLLPICHHRARWSNPHWLPYGSAAWGAYSTKSIQSRKCTWGGWTPTSCEQQRAFFLKLLPKNQKMEF